MQAVLRAACRAAADLLFPRNCVHCAGPVETGSYQYLCPACTRALQFCEPPACKTCGYPYFGSVIAPRECPHCAELEPVFDKGKTLFLAKGPGRSLLHALKYHQGFYILKDLTRMLKETPHFKEFLSGAILVPVPLHPTKLRERGFNQSEHLAHTLLQNSDARAVEPLLLRSEFTHSQTHLDRKDRLQNVKNAFALSATANLMNDTYYILVDDVFTTGSTLNACARTLRTAGVTHLRAVAIGHG
ncbi:MAG: ComF family protein [Verrucomicrobia bacterium]|nr:ComF family protein [Verrucomicrobiota bacterium]